MLLAKQNIAFRSHRNEDAAFLEDADVNHGKFLELVLLLIKYDVVLKLNIEKAIKKGKANRKTGESRGRGSFISFLSKNTGSKLLKICSTYIRGRIIADVLEVGKCSVQMESTQVIVVQDQLVIVLRYVKSGIVHEHLYRFLRIEGSSTSASLCDMLKKELANDGLSIADVIHDSFAKSITRFSLHSLLCPCFESCHGELHL